MGLTFSLSRVHLSAQRHNLYLLSGLWHLHRLVIA